MARKKNTKKRRSGLLGALVLLILLGVMAYKLVEVYGDLSVGKEREARLRTQKEQKQEEVNSLKDALSHADDPDYILAVSYTHLIRQPAAAGRHAPAGADLRCHACYPPRRVINAPPAPHFSDSWQSVQKRIWSCLPVSSHIAT